jgi:hypothetical protein
MRRLASHGLPQFDFPAQFPVTTVPLTRLLPKRSLTFMRLELSADQESQLELISLHAGKPAAQLLTDAARYLCENDMVFLESVQHGFTPSNFQHFLDPDQLDQRFATILRR